MRGLTGWATLPPLNGFGKITPFAGLRLNLRAQEPKMAKDQPTRQGETAESKDSGEKQKPSLVEILKNKLLTKRQKLKKEDPHIYPMW